MPGRLLKQQSQGVLPLRNFAMCDKSMGYEVAFLCARGDIGPVSGTRLGYEWMRMMQPVRTVRTQVLLTEEGAYPQAYDALASPARRNLAFEEFVAQSQQNHTIRRCVAKSAASTT